MKRQYLFQIVQGPLVVVVAGILMNVAFQAVPTLSILAEHRVSLPVPESIGAFFGQFTFPDFSRVFDPAVLLTGVTIAVVASLETLLCVEATDKLDPYKRVTPTNRELKAQGVGNLVSGLIGGLPVTQVIVRSSANIQSGGRTKASAILHGIILLLCAMSIPAVLNMIPLASLAAILFLVGYKLAKPSLFKQLYKQGQTQFVPFIVTILGIVFTDLLMGIGMGLVVAIFYILFNNFRSSDFIRPHEEGDGQPIVLKLWEHVTFINKASILKALADIPSGEKVIIDASETVTMDLDVVEIIQDFRMHAEFEDIEVTYIPPKNTVQLVPKASRQRSNGVARPIDTEV